jgi:hypothetical protein
LRPSGTSHGFVYVSRFIETEWIEEHFVKLNIVLTGFVIGNHFEETLEIKQFGEFAWTSFALKTVSPGN